MKATNPLQSFARLDPFGVVWFSLLYLVVLIAKWWFVQPDIISPENCMTCVVAVAVIMGVIVSLLPSVLWILSSDRKAIGMGFYLTTGGLIILCTLLFSRLVRIIVGKLYFSGNLVWLEDQSSILLDEVVPQLSGLYLACIMLYLSIRMLFTITQENRLPMVATSVVIIGCSSGLLFLGVKLY